MKRLFFAVLALLTCLALPALAAVPSGKNTYIVAPFSVQGPQSYAYLQRSIPQMITSRMFWKDRVEPARELGLNAKPVTGEQEAEQLRQQYKADYVVWGTVTIVNEQCSLDVRVQGKSGSAWAHSRETRASQVISAVSGITDALNRDLFGRAPITGQSQAQSKDSGPINRMNPDIMVNETSSREVYLNPQFRYSGSSVEDDSRLRSQALPFPAIGMEVADVDGDGRNEVLVLSDHSLRAYSFEGGQLRPKGEFSFPMNNQCLSVRSLPRPTGKAWIIVNQVDSKSHPQSSILTFGGGAFTEEMSNLRWYLNVVKLPPDYRLTLLGQEANPPRLFKPGVFEMTPQGGTLVPGKRLDLPSEANVFNFAWMPPTRGERGGEKLVLLTGDESLRVYGPKMARLSATSEKYSGSALGLEIDPSMPGLKRDDVTLASIFYIPMRILPVDLEHDGNWEVIVNKPISTASQIFDRYRFFPQSEIHCLYWDGVGLNLQWKTRRIKGSMVDYTIADANNDGIPDLVCCINTHPGALGVKSRRGMVLIYPLDTSRIDPATPADRSDIYE